jgi:pentatricopeptide repeat protein
MTSLSQVPQRKTGKGKNKVDPNELFRVSLVFQEMKSAGVEPDLACYNVMLTACAKSGDVDRAMEVLDQIRASDEMEPNEMTWDSIIRAAGKAGRSDVALAMWKNSVEDHLVGRKDDRRSSRRRHLNDQSLAALISALIQNAEEGNMDRLTEVRLYQLVVKIWESIASKSEFLGMNLVNKERILENTRIMGAFLHAIVSLENFVVIDGEDMKIDKDRLRQLGISIVQLNCFRGGISSLRNTAAIATAYQVACSWVI